MIWETVAVLLFILVMYHIYRSRNYGHDFIGDLTNSMCSGMSMPFRSSTALSHPSTWGVSQRQMGTGSRTLSTAFTVVGPKVNNGVGSNEWTPAMGNPIGLPAVGAPTDPNAISSNIPGAPPQPVFELGASND